MAREYEGLAQALASRGRYGDSMLMHVNPEEVDLLNNLAPGGITVNPDTGLPEAFELFSLASILSAFLGPTLGGSLAGGITSVLTTLGIGGGTVAASAAPTVAAATVPTATVALGAPALGVGAGALPMGFGASGASIVAPGALGGGAIGGGAGGGAIGGGLTGGALGGTAVGGMPVSLLGAGGAPSLGTLSGGAITGAAPATVPGATLPGIAGGALPELSLGVPSLPSALPTASPFAVPGAAPGAVPGAVPGAAPAGPLPAGPAPVPPVEPGLFETGLKVLGELGPRALVAGLGADMLMGDEDYDDEEFEELSEEEIASRGAFEDFTPPGPPVGSDIVGSPTDEAFGTFVSDPSMVVEPYTMPGAAGIEDIGTLASATMAPPPSGIGGEQIAALGGGELYMDYMNSGSPFTFEEWIQMEGLAP